ncbi:MAG: hypothetical protein ACE5JR_06545 [Gemmatimonadota bacterium]
MARRTGVARSTQGRAPKRPDARVLSLVLALLLGASGPAAAQGLDARLVRASVLSETAARLWLSESAARLWLTPAVPDAAPAAATSPVSGHDPVGGMLLHETAVGAFIDPLVTEHAFVDRKLRSDFGARFAREDEEGRRYENVFVFEYAFTDWLALELTQPLIFTDPEEAPGESGLGDLGWAAKFEFLHPEVGDGIILATGLEGSLPSGLEEVGGGEEYVVAPFFAADWAIGPGRFKLQTNAEAEFVIPRGEGESELEAIEWNVALSFFATERVVPLIELNTEFEELQEDASKAIYAITPGLVISLKDIAGTSFDIAAGAQIFFGEDREEDLALLVSLRHHWPFERSEPGALNHAD